MSLYNVIVSSTESTVVAEYTARYDHSGSYQSEAALENEFIRVLQTKGMSI